MKSTTALHLTVNKIISVILFPIWSLSAGAQLPQDTLKAIVVSSPMEPARCDSIPADTPTVATPSQPHGGDLYGRVRRTVRGFDHLNKDYIEPQHYLFTVMLQATSNYDVYTLRSSGGTPQSITFAPDMRMKLGPYVGWKWFFAGYTFDIGRIDLHRLKQEVDLSIYSSQIGLDLFYRKTGSDYKLRDAQLGETTGTRRLENIPFGGISAGITGANVYYIFNHGRFSYPAAFSQSTCQKISCGSWMAGIGYTKNSLELDHQRLQQLIDERLGANTVQIDSGLMFNKITYSDLSFSGGYAYNWVVAKNLLLAGSLQLGLAYKKSKGEVELNRREGFRFENVNFDGIGRFGIVYNNMRWYTGMSAIVRTFNYRKPRYRTNNTFGSLNVYVGYNFALKKKYRTKQL